MRHQTPSFKPLSSGFSLVEIVLALGIISFALVGILGLFPVALDTARDSKAETMITFIGQSIMADIHGTKRTNTTGTPPVTSTDSLINTNTTPASLSLLAASSTLYLSYDSEGLCQKELTESEYNSGVADAAYLVQLTSEYSPASYSDLNRIQLNIEFPAAAPTQFRQTRSFLRLIRP